MFSLKKSDKIKLISAKEISFDEASAMRQIFQNNINNDDDKDGSTVVEKKSKTKMIIITLFYVRRYFNIN